MDRAQLMARDAHAVLSRVESAKSRILTLNASYAALGDLSLKQDDLFRQGLRCVEAELYRAAHVMAWAAFMDFLHDKLAEDGLTTLRRARSSWSVNAVDDLRNWGDYQVIEAGKDCGLYGRTVMKALHGLLNKRNECAHPEDYYPGQNDTLGYIDELFKRLRMLRQANLS